MNKPGSYRNYSDPYPLDQQILDSKKECPEISGRRGQFAEACAEAAEALLEKGHISLRYGCLSAFDVSITDYLNMIGGRPTSVPDDPDFYLVAVGCGSYGGKYPQPISTADPYYVGVKLNLLEHDAKAIAYLLRQIGQRVRDLRFDAQEADRGNA